MGAVVVVIAILAAVAWKLRSDGAKNPIEYQANSEDVQGGSAPAAFSIKSGAQAQHDRVNSLFSMASAEIDFNYDEQGLGKAFSIHEAAAASQTQDDDPYEL